MADLAHVDTQLVAAACFGVKTHPGGAVFSALHAPIGHGGLAFVEIDLLQGAVRPIHDQRQVNGSRRLFHGSPNPRDVGFARGAGLELFAEVALRMRAKGEYHDA